MTAGTWLKLVRENRFDIDPGCLPRAAAITAASLLNSLCRPIDEIRTASLASTRGQECRDPVFIIGHWRSGTTHLHNMIAADPRVTTPNLCQVLWPHSFLTAGWALRLLLKHALPPTRLIDRMAFDPDLPQEDEFALCALTGLSPYVAYAFPHRWRHYDRYLTFASVPPAETRTWQDALRRYVAKLTAVDDRILVLKSPPHTARIEAILEVFPKARFVHLHRDPFRVYQSTCRMLGLAPPLVGLHHIDPGGIEEIVLTRYESLYGAFLAQRGLIPPDQLFELSFASLLRDPVGQLRRIYAHLWLQPIEPALSHVERYLQSVGSYRAGSYDPLPARTAQAVRSRWEIFFESWGYPARPASIAVPS